MRPAVLDFRGVEAIFFFWRKGVAFHRFGVLPLVSFHPFLSPPWCN